MQVKRRRAYQPRTLGRLALWLPAIASALAYAGLALVSSTSDASARGRPPAIKARFVERQSVLPAESVSTFTARCPKAAPRAVGPEFGPLSNAGAGQLALAGSFPHGSAWTVQVKNLSGQPQEYFEGVTCLGAPRTRFAVVRTGTVIDPQTDAVAGIRCPRSSRFPVNATYQAQPGSTPGSAVANVTLSMTDRRNRPTGQFAAMRNLTDAPVAVFLGAVCTSARVTWNEWQATVPAGGSYAGYTDCQRRGQLAVGGEFFAVDPKLSSAIVLDGFSVRSVAQWSVGGRNLTARPITYVGSASCIG
jgi:hypothetical protein